MYEVGTNAGNVNNQRQGTGLATILPGPGKEIDVAIDLQKERMALAKKRDAETQASRDAVVKKMQSVPDYWYRHDAELASKVSGIQDKGATLMASGIVDPFTSQDPRAVEFRKEFDRTNQLAVASKQLKDSYTAMRGDIDKAGPDDYDDQTLIDIDKFYSQPLSTIVENGGVPPNLIKKRPYTDAFDLIGKNMAEWSRGWNGNIPDDAKTFDFVNALVNDPAKREQVVRTYGSKLKQMSPAEQKDIMDRAKAQSIEPHVVMAMDDANRWKVMKTPFDPLAALSSAAKTVEGAIDYKTTSNPNYLKTDFSKKDMEAALDATAMATFNSRGEWMEYYKEKVPRLKSDNDGEYARRVKLAMRDDIKALVGTKTTSEVKDKGYTTQVRQTTRNQWIQDLRSGDPKLSTAAAQWVTGTKMFNNLDVAYTQVVQGPGGPTFELAITTPLTVAQVKKTIEDEGGSTDDVEFVDKQGKIMLSVPLSGSNTVNQWLAQVYDRTFDQRADQPYDSKISERTPQTIDQTRNYTAPLTNQRTPGSPAPLVTPAPGTMNNLFGQ